MPKDIGVSSASSDTGILNAAMAEDDGLTTDWAANNTNNNTNGLYKDNFYPNGPFRGALSGFYQNGFNYQGKYSFYWTGTAYSATASHNLFSATTYIYPSNYNVKRYGFAVRCLVGE